MEKKVSTICFDYSHNNKLIIENSSFNDFVAYLFSSGFRVGQIKQGISKEKLSQYNIFIMGNPYQSNFEVEEIKAIEEYVKEGGGLFIISDEEGDRGNEINLNDLTTKFGFVFNPDKISDSMIYVKDQDKPLIKDLEPHFITKDVEQFVHSSGCSIDIDQTVEADQNIMIHILARTGLNSFCTVWNGQEYEEEDAPRRPVLVAVDYYKGKVVGLGNVSIFSSLSPFYGFNAFGNRILISNIINWLSSSSSSLEASAMNNKLVSININTNLYMWMEKIITDKEWEKMADIINFSLKYIKDHYQQVMKETQELREKLKQQREAAKKSEEEALKREKKDKGEITDDEEELLDLPKDNKRTEEETKTFEDLMSELTKLSDPNKK